jgi:hypothetical protein
MLYRKEAPGALSKTCFFVGLMICVSLITGQSLAQSPYPRNWLDEDGDCRNTRQEILLAQSTAPVRFATKRNCRVVAGRWISPYTGAVLHDPAHIDIDHVVPLQWAWTHGAERWTHDRWMGFVNDPANLLIVEARLNRQKGAKGLDEWLPPGNQCQYVARYLRILKHHRLTLSAEENRNHRTILNKVCHR